MAIQRIELSNTPNTSAVTNEAEHLVMYRKFKRLLSYQYQQGIISVGNTEGVTGGFPYVDYDDTVISDPPLVLEPVFQSVLDNCVPATLDPMDKAVYEQIIEYTRIQGAYLMRNVMNGSNTVVEQDLLDAIPPTTAKFFYGSYAEFRYYEEWQQQRILGNEPLLG